MRLEDTVKSASGLYTVAEAALYAKIPVNTLCYWLYGDRSHAALRGSLIPKTEGRFLTFLEFVEALAVRTLRNTYGLSLQKIRGALELAKQEYHVDYPFANREHKTFLIGSDLHIIVGDNLNPVQITGKNKRQQSMRQCIEQFMRDLQFDDKRTAVSYIAYRYPVPNEQRTINVTMNPRYCFGDPVVEGTGHRAETLWRASVAEGSEQRASELYEVKLDEVIAACRYCDEVEMAA
jgi:uncharacterized protein (DUF433 family)